MEALALKSRCVCATPRGLIQETQVVLEAAFKVLQTPFEQGHVWEPLVLIPTPTLPPLHLLGILGGCQ